MFGDIRRDPPRFVASDKTRWQKTAPAF